MIADRLRLARRKAGFSLRDLSAAMDRRVTAQAIGKYERGESVPSSGVLLALSKALDVSLNYLMDTQGVQLAGVEFRTKATHRPSLLIVPPSRAPTEHHSDTETQSHNVTQRIRRARNA